MAKSGVFPFSWAFELVGFVGLALMILALIGMISKWFFLVGLAFIFVAHEAIR